jgi:hypothetical protein
MPLPEWPPRSRDVLNTIGLPELFNWWQDFKSFINNSLSTDGNVTLKAGKGIVLTSADGTQTKTVYLKNDGTLSL